MNKWHILKISGTHIYRTEIQADRQTRQDKTRQDRETDRYIWTDKQDKTDTVRQRKTRQTRQDR